MSELWDTLTTGLILSLLFIGVSYFFWKRYDKPTPLMIERQEEKARLKEERKTWREVEARIRAEQEEAELIQRLRNTQDMQKQAYQELQSSLME